MVPVSSGIYSGPMTGGMGSPAMAQMPAIPSHSGMPQGHGTPMVPSGHYGGMGAPLQPVQSLCKQCGVQVLAPVCLVDTESACRDVLCSAMLIRRRAPVV